MVVFNLSSVRRKNVGVRGVEMKAKDKWWRWRREVRDWARVFAARCRDS